jgi:hypothetical protein
VNKDPFKPQIKTHLEDILPGIWLEGFGEVKVNLENNPSLKGATDAFFYEVEATIKFVIKFGLNDVPKEKLGHKILETASPSLKGHLVPLIGKDKELDDLGLNKALLLTPYINSITLHDLVSQKVIHKKWLFDLYLDFLNEQKKLWEITRKPKKPCYEELYLHRLTSRFLAFKEECGLNKNLKVTLIVNNKKINLEEEIIPEIQNRLVKICDKLRFSCTIHGDEHAKNILIRRNCVGVDKRAWALIDCGNAREDGDWIFSIAKILHWWKVYFAIENAKKNKDLEGDFSSDKDRIIIKYNKRSFRNDIPNICNELYDQTLVFCKRVNKEIFREKPAAWQERLKIALFINLFGAVTRHLSRESKFAIPFLIGESFDFLQKL